MAPLRRATVPCSIARTVAALLLVFAGAGGGGATETSGVSASGPGVMLAAGERMPTNIRMTVNGQVVTATLDDTQAAAEFVSLLPLTLTLTDYNSTEKISDLPRRLAHDGAPSGYDPEVGDITYYAPWGNLAVFYRDFGYSRGLIRLGTITSGVSLMQQSGPLRATIERVEP